MKIMLIHSSGRTNGNTERLLRTLENELVKAAERQRIPMEIRYVALAEREIHPCRGCRRCFDRGSCPYQDAVAEVETFITDCDALVLAGPVYLEDINGIMKTWMDRMAFQAHRPAYFGKYAVALATSGAGASGHAQKTMRNALMAWGFHILFTRRFRMGTYMEDTLLAERYRGQLSEMAMTLVTSFQKSAAQKPTLFSLVSFHIQQKYYRTSPHAGALDRAYWQEKGWLHSGTHFYMPVKCQPVKLLIANVIGAILSAGFL